METALLRDAADLMTVPEAANALRIGKNRAYALVREGEIPSVRIGHSVRIPRVSLEAYLREKVGT